MELTEVKTKTLAFTAGDFEWSIPLSRASTIRLSEDGKTYTLDTVAGMRLTGEPRSGDKLEGLWDLGEYSAFYTDLKSVRFPETSRPDEKKTDAPEDRGSSRCFGDMQKPRRVNGRGLQCGIQLHLLWK